MPSPRSDKEVIHLDYISTDLSLRALSRKHNVSVSTLQNWKAKGHWDIERQVMRAEATERAAENLNTDKVQALDSLTDRMEKVLAAADKLLKKVYQLLDLEDALAPRDLKSISSVLVDVMMMQTNKQESDSKQDKNDSITVTWVNNPWDAEGQ